MNYLGTRTNEAEHNISNKCLFISNLIRIKQFMVSKIVAASKSIAKVIWKETLLLCTSTSTNINHFVTV